MYNSFLVVDMKGKSEQDIKDAVVSLLGITENDRMYRKRAIDRAGSHKEIPHRRGKPSKLSRTSWYH